MLRHKEKWKRVAEKIHPFEYKKHFPQCFEAFDILRNNKPFETYFSQIEKLLLKKDIESLLSVLMKRPGEFARRLDHLLRIAADAELVLSSFKKVSNEVSSPVLLQVFAHFKYRNKKNDVRVFFPKGNVGKLYAIKDLQKNIEETVRQNVVSICKKSLIYHYKKRSSLGNCYLDSNLKNYLVPFALRSASKSLKTLTRGTTLSLPEGNTLRFFIYWKDGEERTDVDLSAVALDQNHVFQTTVSYLNLRELGGYHSGDITSAPYGASEFIDIDIRAFLEKGTRYLIMSINSYTNQPFCDLPECFAGIMMRKYPDSGEVYEVKTVENKIDISSDTQICIPLIIDLEEKKLIWTDIALHKNMRSNNNVLQNMSSLTLMSKSMTSLRKPHLYDLFDLHIQARGKKTKKKQNADTIFTEKNGITPFETEQIIAEFL